jgi:hypothetical protein
MTHHSTDLHLYWMNQGDFHAARDLLKREGYRLSATLLTPCQVLRAEGKRVVYAPPKIWNGMCKRQGSWYRESERAGQTMLVSRGRLPAALDVHLDAILAATDFMPQALPAEAELEDLVESSEYRSGQPGDWERLSRLDAPLFKAFFTLNGTWGRGDNLKRHWIGQRANHANFLAKRFTTRLDGEEVPYSVTRTKRVCSSCAEFFNVVERSARKLVRACPGAVTFGGAQRDAFLDVRPQRTTG